MLDTKKKGNGEREAFVLAAGVSPRVGKLGLFLVSWTAGLTLLSLVSGGGEEAKAESACASELQPLTHEAEAGDADNAPAPPPGRRGLLVAVDRLFAGESHLRTGSEADLLADWQQFRLVSESEPAVFLFRDGGAEERIYELSLDGRAVAGTVSLDGRDGHWHVTGIGAPTTDMDRLDDEDQEALLVALLLSRLQEEKEGPGSVDLELADEAALASSDP